MPGPDEPEGTPTFTLTPTLIPTSTPTPQPTGIITVDTLCWVETDYGADVLSSIPKGTQVTIVGVGDIPGYIVIYNPRPAYEGRICWVLERHIDIPDTVDLDVMPEFKIYFTPTPTPLPTPTFTPDLKSKP